MNEIPKHKLTIAIAANFIVTEIRDSLLLWFEELDIDGSLCFAPYDSIIQQLIDPNGTFSDADFVVICLQIEKWIRPDSQPSASALAQNLGSFIDGVKTEINRSPAREILVMSCPSSEGALPREFILSAEGKLCEELRKLSNVEIISREDLDAYYPTKNDQEYFIENNAFLEGSQYSQLFFATIGTMVARRLYGKFRRPRKVVVVDCDNTLSPAFALR